MQLRLLFLANVIYLRHLVTHILKIESLYLQHSSSWLLIKHMQVLYLSYQRASFNNYNTLCQHCFICTFNFSLNLRTILNQNENFTLL